ncbi:MAG: hypothetical protein RLZZ458_1594, partial [Planctomycetota bacterium]
MTAGEPSESRLRQQLAAVYSDPNDLERAIAGLKSLGLTAQS